jgi:hypothetical protein
VLRDHEEEKQQVDAAVAKKLCKMMSAHHLHVRSDGHGIIEANNGAGVGHFRRRKTRDVAEITRSGDDAHWASQHETQRVYPRACRQRERESSTQATAPAHSQTECVVCVLFVSVRRMKSSSRGTNYLLHRSGPLLSLH